MAVCTCQCWYLREMIGLDTYIFENWNLSFVFLCCDFEEEEIVINQSCRGMVYMLGSINVEKVFVWIILNLIILSQLYAITFFLGEQYVAMGRFRMVNTSAWLFAFQYLQRSGDSSLKKVQDGFQHVFPHYSIISEVVIVVGRRLRMAIVVEFVEVEIFDKHIHDQICQENYVVGA